MNKSLLKELLELTPAERIELAQDLWERNEAEEIPPLTVDQKPEAERRYAEHVRNPEAASRWDDVKARLDAVSGLRTCSANRRSASCFCSTVSGGISSGS